MAKKSENYTKEQAEELVAAYTDCDSDESRKECVETFAEKFGKTPASIRAKLVSESVYQKQEYKTKTGSKPESKENIVADIARTVGAGAEALESLTKANKKALQVIRTALKVAADREAEAGE
jgi:hypothetical protein